MSRSGAGIVVVALAVLPACSQEASDAEGVSETSDRLFLKGQTWPSGSVNVCYDDSTPGAAGLAIAAQTELAATWKRMVGVGFTSQGSDGSVTIQWGKCNVAAGSRGNFSTIVLHFCTGSSTSSHCDPKNYLDGTRAVGKFKGASFEGRVAPTIGPRPGMIFPGLTHTSIIGDDQDPLKTLFRYQVLHEFGHALGFHHEQDRSDNLQADGRTPRCAKDIKATSGGQFLTDFDDGSIMNYCTRDPVTNGQPFWLSFRDIAGARVPYPRSTTRHGFMIKSDQNAARAFNALNGARNEGELAVHTACASNNPDCTWSYHLGMLVSDKDPTLAINAFGGAADGVLLKLSNLCTPSNKDCTWRYESGRFLSDNDLGLAITTNSAGKLVLKRNCSSGDSACRWTLSDLLLSSYRDPALGVNAIDGARNHADIGLHDNCSENNSDCTFTWSGGLIKSSANSSLALNAFGGAGPGQRVEINNLCTAGNTDCRWYWDRGIIRIENGAWELTPVGGDATHLTRLTLASSSCSDNDPDCRFSSLMARP